MDDLLEMYNVARAERLSDAANPVKLPVQNLHPDWPTDAEYRAVYRLQAWPTDAMSHVGVSPKFLPLFDLYKVVGKNVSPGMFGSGPRATAYKFTDPDLSARANAELVKGFPIKVYHHAE